MNIYFIASIIAFSVCALLAIFVYIKNPKSNINKSFSLVTFLVGAWCLFPSATALSKNILRATFFARLVYIAAIFVPPTFLHFLFNLIGISRIEKERKKLIFFYLISSIFLIFIFSPTFIKGVITFAPYFAVEPGKLYSVFFLYFIMMVVLGYYKTFIEYLQVSGYKRNQLIYIMISFGVAALAGLIHFLAAYGVKEIVPHDFLVVIYTLIFTYAIVRYRLLEIRIAAARTAIFVLVYSIILGIAFALNSFGRYWLINIFGENWTWPLLILTIASSSAAPFIYMRLQHRAEDALLKERRKYQQALRDASIEMTRIRELDKLLRTIIITVVKEIGLRSSAIYIFQKANTQEEKDKFILKDALGYKQDRRPPSQILIDDPLAKLLENSRRPLTFEEIQNHNLLSTQETKEILSQMKQLNAQLIVPSFVMDEFVGFLVLGQKTTGDIFGPDDIGVFQAIANYAGIAIEGARFHEEFQKSQMMLFETAKLASVGQMANMASHQQNNAFNVISTKAEARYILLEQIRQKGWPTNPQELSELLNKVMEELKIITDYAQKGGDVARKIMKFSRPSGKEGYQPMNIKDSIDIALDICSIAIDPEDILLNLDIRPNLPQIKGDKNMLADSTQNMLLNAKDAISLKRQYMKLEKIPKESNYKGKIDIRVYLSEDDPKRPVAVEITDNGIGMSEEDLKQVFIPFFTTKGAEKGNGLGLSSIKMIVESHGGTISVKSKYNQGTTFTIRLPKI